MQRLINARFFATIALLFVVSASTACSSNIDDDGELDKPRANENKVVLFDFKFKPSELEVRKGTKVTWTNKDKTSHGLKAENGDFDEVLGSGESFSFTFENAGTVRYLNPQDSSGLMNGKIIVK